MNKIIPNEATLEVTISKIMSQVFPTFREVSLEHQKSFSVKVGHHRIVVTAKTPNRKSVRAISDILFKVGEKNVIMLELKNVNAKLTDNDRDQGISYARLLDQIPPITLVSNGKDNIFYDTYTKEKIDRDTIDWKVIQDRIDNAFEIATKDLRDAIDLLLNNDPELFASVINGISDEKFTTFKGDISDSTASLCDDFQVERTILKEINSVLAKGQSLVGLQGTAFSGKTTLLYQIHQKLTSENNFVYFIDCNDLNMSIFSQLANSFTTSTKNPISPDQIRNWLIASLNNDNSGKFYLLLDNFNKNISETVMAEILELIDLFQGSQHKILYTIDEFNYKQIADVSHRNYKTTVGKKSCVLKLNDFDNQEYDDARKIMFNRFKVTIERGGFFTEEYREPRILRYLLSAHYYLDLKENEVVKIVAVPDLELLRTIAQNKIFPKRIHQLYQKIATCFVEEVEVRSTFTELRSAAIGSGAILTTTFKTKYPDDYQELVQTSLILIRDLPIVDQSIIYPKLP